MAKRSGHKPIRSKKNPIEWHGHRIVTENDLEQVFADDGNVERPHAYMRRLRHGIVLVLLVAVLAAAVYFALALARGDIKLEAGELPAPIVPDACPAGPFEPVDPKSVTVNVLNSTSIAGLADNAATALEERGFAVELIGNRTIGSTNMTAVVVSGPDGYAQAFTLQRLIPNSVYLEDERPDATVDVVLGSEFESLVAADKVNAEPGPLVCELPSTATPTASPTATPTA
ncbi:LytR family transcriptional regulator [Arthrobacter sp. JZ12]|uniref:LytR C-terminal domain-containing protein n=1 Tax=Arthrobacter sp. JZ12 TaxID=2654190 RepID=UPI002B46EC6E|nr:LytR C-terminal domain-containing protein [Arthrobacter sp. JZ12]WRH23937.1 LytR family transcriptional regulator [Arthrobacter sp. JZ12]